MPNPEEREVHNALQASLLTTSIKLNETYSQAAFELRIGRLSLRSIRPLISSIEHIRRELAWGMPLKQPPELRRRSSSKSVPLQVDHAPSDKFHAIIGPTAQNLGYTVLNAIHCIEATILFAYRPQNTSSPRFSLFSSSVQDDLKGVETQLMAIQAAEKQLSMAIEDSKDKFGVLYQDIHLGEVAGGSPVEVPKEIYDGSLAMIALLQMAGEMTTALKVAERLVLLCLQNPSRLWYPRLTLAWLGVLPGPFISDDPSANLSVNFALEEHPMHSADNPLLSEFERRQGMAEYAKRLAKKKVRETSDLKEKNGRTLKACGSFRSLLNGFVSLLSWCWTNNRTMDFRVHLWGFMRALKHSHHLRHALKNAVGVATLTFPAFLPPTSPTFRWYQSWHGQWMTISYLWVLETNTGSTWRTGYLRILGTCIGAVHAYIIWAICRVNPYGLVVLVTAADIPITWFITQTNLAPLAVPYSVTIASVSFAKYTTPDMTQPIIDLALLRALMITAGMVAALLMNSILFPRHGRVLFLSHTSRTFGLLSNLYLTLSHEMFHAKNPEDRSKVLKYELQTRNELYRLSALIMTMKNELSLLPKPLRHYRKVVLNMQKFLDLLTGLRKIRENLPRQESVIDVFTERRAFMSSICILMYACQHVFRTREPLPQFLPSARHALGILEHHTHDCLRKAPRHDARAFGVSLGYVFAEQETMRNMVNALEKLLELSGELFGTSAWLTQDGSWSTATMVDRDDEDLDGWYSTLPARSEDV
ncbi:hypothetical protein EUX98_g7828 [Antrodiella citrinella]|uniref:Uncharacterized protein n=1 Tax=Antrodiella citrinella TaxID=2447956 RepID=A0A4S4MSN4_9APHY|nr:hypothetical protein EUX98_g7828 [Antrodiella citrinella]